MTDVETLIETLHTHRDALERFFALYDLYRLLKQGTPNVADALHVFQAMQQAAAHDRDHHIRAWAHYYHHRLLGEVPTEAAPHLPKQWQLFIVKSPL